MLRRFASSLLLGALLGACSPTATGVATPDGGAATPPPVTGGGEPTPPAPTPLDGSVPTAVVDGAAAPDAPAPPPAAGAGPDTVVTPFSGPHVYFVGSMDNKRSVDATATFPEMPLSYERITLNFG